MENILAVFTLRSNCGQAIEDNLRGKNIYFVTFSYTSPFSKSITSYIAGMTIIIIHWVIVKLYTYIYIFIYLISKIHCIYEVAQIPFH